MLTLAAGMVVSLLPERYRSWWPRASSADFRHATIFSGAVEAFGCLGLYIGRYLYFIQYRVGTLADAAIKPGGGAEEALGSTAAQFGMGYVSLVEYVFMPLSMLLVYFTLEGVLRLLAAALTEDNPGTLSLYLVAWAVGRARRGLAERALGPLVVDEVQKRDLRGFDLRIASCRPKKHWDRLMTIAFEDEHYEVVKEELGIPPRPYVYLLQKISPGKVIRGLHHYRPDEVLPAEKK